MFYSINMLRKKDGLYAVVWLHATNQRVSKKMAQSANVPELADALIQEEIPLALRTSACLLIGIVRIYETCVSVGWREATNVRFYTGSKRSSLSSANSNMIDMPKKKMKRISIDMGWDEDEFLQQLEGPLFGENNSEDLAHMYERINERGIRPEDTLMLETPSNLLDATPGMDTDLNFGYSFSRSNLLLDAGSTPGRTPNSRRQDTRTPKSHETAGTRNSPEQQLFDEPMHDDFPVPTTELPCGQQQSPSPSLQAEKSVDISPLKMTHDRKRATPEDSLHNLSFNSQEELEPARKRNKRRKLKKVNLRDPKTEIDTEEWQRMHDPENDYLTRRHRNFGSVKPKSITEMFNSSCGCFNIGAKNFKLLTSSKRSKFASLTASKANIHDDQQNVQAGDTLSDVEERRGPEDSRVSGLDLDDDKLSVKSGKSEQSMRSARLSAMPNPDEMMDAEFDQVDLNMETGNNYQPVVGELDPSFAEERDPNTRAELLLRSITEVSEGDDEEYIDFTEIAQGKTRAARAGAFYSLLVLATTKRVDVQQDRDEYGSVGKILMSLV